jgi:hypothetical protein
LIIKDKETTVVHIAFRGGYTAFVDYVVKWMPWEEQNQALLFTTLNSCNWFLGVLQGKQFKTASFLWFMGVNIIVNGHLALNSNSTKMPVYQMVTNKEPGLYENLGCIEYLLSS